MLPIIYLLRFLLLFRKTGLGSELFCLLIYIIRVSAQEKFIKERNVYGLYLSLIFSDAMNHVFPFITKGAHNLNVRKYFSWHSEFDIEATRFSL